METVTDFIFLGSKITADGDCRHEIKRHLLLGGKAMTNLDNILKSRDLALLTKVHLVKATVFPVVVYGCESWTMKKAEHWRIDAFELWCWRRLLRVPWTARRSNQSILKENQSWIFIGRTDARAEAAILWPPDVKSWLIGKNPEAGKYWRREEKGMTEDEMVGWHHQLYGHEFEQAPGVGDRQGGLVCCSPWVCKELDMTEWLDWTYWTSNFIRERRIFPEYLKRFKYLKLLAYVTNWIQVLHFSHWFWSLYWILQVMRLVFSWNMMVVIRLSAILYSPKIWSYG